MKPPLLPNRPGLSPRSPVSAELVPKLIATILACAEIARATIAPHFRNLGGVLNKEGDNGFDPVTAADTAAEKAIRRHIQACFPQHGIIGEEFGHQPGPSPITWVIDPIDGTRAFMCGIPSWGTLIAVNDGHGPILGVMDQGYMGERFLGVPGASFTMGPDTPEGLEDLPRLETSDCTQLDQARLSTTDPRLFTAPGERRVYDRLEGEVRLSRYGLDCYAYCLLAAGHIDLVVEAGLQPYDIQALIPIVPVLVAL